MAFKTFKTLVKGASFLNIKWDSKGFKLLNKIFFSEEKVQFQVKSELEKMLYTQYRGKLLLQISFRFCRFNPCLAE